MHISATATRRLRCWMIKVPGPLPLRSRTVRRAGMNQKIALGPQGGVGVGAGQRTLSRRGTPIVQLDGDPANCEPGNLDCVPRRPCIARLNAYHAPAYAAGDKDANQGDGSA